MTGLLLDNIGSLVTSDPGIGEGPLGLVRSDWSARLDLRRRCRGLAGPGRAAAASAAAWGRCHPLGDPGQ